MRDINKNNENHKMLMMIDCYFCNFNYVSKKDVAFKSVSNRMMISNDFLHNTLIIALNEMGYVNNKNEIY